MQISRSQTITLLVNDKFKKVINGSRPKKT